MISDERLAEIASDIECPLPIRNVVTTSVRMELIVLLRELQRLREEQKQWEPQWNTIAEANAAGYNEAMEKFNREAAERARGKE